MRDAVVHFYPDNTMTINQTALCPDKKKRIPEKQLYNILHSPHSKI